MNDYKKNELYSELGLCTKTKCETCVYCYNAKSIERSCDYILVEEKRRPCPAGTNCTVYKKREVKKRLKAGKLA